MKDDTLKRALDVTAAGVGLLVTMPVQGVIALAVRINMGRPILFRQQRPGLNAQPFILLKFRTMHHPNPEVGRLDDASRLTRLGRLLRATSLDELPSLINVLRGEMSLVGPRPLRMEYLPHYTEREATRHLVRPGITGLAQISGRNAISWRERLELDAQYVESRSFMLDMRILLKTVASVARREGTTAEGYATMRPFLVDGRRCD